MPNANRWAGPAQTPGEHLHAVDGSVLATGTSDGHREVAALLLGIGGQPLLNELLNVGDHLVDAGLLLEKSLDLRVFAGQAPKAGVVMGVGQTAHIEDEVCIERDPILEGK